MVYVSTKRKLTELGEFIEARRKGRYPSVRALASAADVSHTTLLRLMHGPVKDPEPKTLEAVGKALEVDPGRLMRLAGLPIPADRSQRDPAVERIAQRLDGLVPEYRDIAVASLRAVLDGLERQAAAASFELVPLAACIHCRRALGGHVDPQRGRVYRHPHDSECIGSEKMVEAATPERGVREMLVAAIGPRDREEARRFASTLVKDTNDGVDADEVVRHLDNFDELIRRAGPESSEGLQGLYELYFERIHIDPLNGLMYPVFTPEVRAVLDATQSADEDLDGDAEIERQLRDLATAQRSIGDAQADTIDTAMDQDSEGEAGKTRGQAGKRVS